MDKVRIVLVDPLAQVPQYHHELDSGCDLRSCENQIILPSERKLINTGIIIEIPQFLEGQVRPRSGLALNHGITVLNAPGTIDAGYRGLIKVILINHGDRPFKIKPGDRIAQLVFVPVFQVEFELTSEFLTTSRNSQGFGSTGIQ